MKMFRSQVSWMLLAASLTVMAVGCKSKQDAAIEQAREKAISTGQPQQVVTTDKNGNTVTTVIQPPAAGQKEPVTTTTVTPKTDASAATGSAPMPPPPDQGSAGQPAPASADSSAAMPPAPAPPPPPAEVHVSAGTTLAIRIDQRISAKENNPGDRFTGALVEPVSDSGQVVIPKGARVRGKVISATGRGKFKGAADIKLRLTALTLNGKEYPLDTRAVQRTQKGKGKRTAGFIGGGTGLGLLIGGIAGGGKGALIGGLAGAGAGTAGAGLTDNKDLVIPAESIVRFKLADELVVELSN